MRLENLRDDVAAGARLLLLQDFDLLGRESLAGRVVDGLAIRPHDEFTVRADFELYAILAVNEQRLALGLRGGGNAVADDFGMQFRSRDDAETRGIAVGEAVGYLKGEMIRATEDVVGLEGAELAD